MLANGKDIVYEVGIGELAVGIGSEEVKQYYEFVTQFQQIYQKAPGTDDWLDRREAAMFSESLATQYADFEDTNVIDFVPIPTYSGEMATSPLWDSGYGIPASSSNSEGAAVLACMICEQY